MNSRYRVKDERICQIQRSMERVKFTINIEDTMTTRDDKVLTTRFTVYYFAPVRPADAGRLRGRLLRGGRDRAARTRRVTFADNGEARVGSNPVRACCANTLRPVIPDKPCSGVRHRRQGASTRGWIWQTSVSPVRTSRYLGSPRFQNACRVSKSVRPKLIALGEDLQPDIEKACQERCLPTCGHTPVGL